MKVINNSHYFSSVTRVYNIVPDTDMFSYESSKRMGLFQRIYFEHLYTLKLGGISLFETLTYNDKSIPMYLGKPCFSYEHIRYITNGALSKYLNRNFGARLRYFCACEKGEGKGNRGIGNNPHYHFIFNIQPLHDKNGNPDLEHFKCPTADEFNNKLKELWQGSSSYICYKDAKFGICKEGLNKGVITSADAFSYVGKYVIKDASDYAYIDWLKEYYSNEVKSLLFAPSTLYDFYLFESFKDDSITLSDILCSLRIHEFNSWRHSDKSNMKFSYLDWLQYSRYDDTKVFATIYQNWFENEYCPYYIDSKISEFKNLYSNKCRYSKSLGLYGLNFIQNVDTNPRVVIPTSNNYLSQYPCLYYIRKLFYNVVKCPHTGNPLYVLSDRGLNFKLNTLEHSIESDNSKILSYVDYVSRNDVFVSDKYSLMKSFINVSVVYKYVVYNHVYRYRHYDDLFKPFIYDSFCIENVFKDYAWYLKQNFYSLDYVDDIIYNLIEKDDTLYSVDNLPCFDSLIPIFSVLDELVKCCDTIFSNASKHTFNARSEHQKRINSYKINTLFLSCTM